MASLLEGDEYSICLRSDHPENITLFYRELVLKTFLGCLYVTVVNISMELVMNRSHGFLQSVITVADMILYQHSAKKAACFQFIGSNSMALPEELLAKHFLPLFFPDEASLLLFISPSLYKYQLSDGFPCEIHIVV